MQQGKNVFKLKGKIQQYAWGGTTFISKLLSVANPENKPFAEYWLGAHENGPSELEGATPSRLNEYIREQPDSILGATVAKRFGRLPYLLKILDVKDMLSIQVHPTKKNAELEFAAENEKGIAITAGNRNYKDDNHKPELMLALSDFWLLHGFKPEEELIRILASVPELKFLQPVFSVEGYKGLYRKVMEMPQQEVNAVLQPLLDRIVPLYKGQRLRKHEEDFWAARAALTYNEGEKIDRGIFSIYFFNLVNVLPGEALFQDAGLPHAYLEGQNVEIMANSDNVLRGGLTPKHVDVPELLKHVRFEATYPRIIRVDDTPGHIVIYKTPAPDFELSKISLQAGEIVTIQSHSVEIFLVLEGKVVVEDGEAFSRSTGEAFIAFDKAKLHLRSDLDATLYRASVPQG
ncbi:MAG TPA: mannose-6-phosphate isomerase, class I [Puia sp.]|nr:mannose-6-phosphate isomerase, class I [Puia sp.]